MIKMHSRCFFMALLSTIAVTQSVVGFPEFKSSFGNGNHHGIIHNLIEDHLKGMEDKDIWNKEPHIGGPNLIEITIKTFDDEIGEFDGSGDEMSQNEVKQIPVISDIERIKKIVQILEVVGNKVIPLIIDNFPAPLVQVQTPTSITDTNDKGLKILNNLKKEIDGVTGNHDKKVLDEVNDG